MYVYITSITLKEIKRIYNFDLIFLLFILAILQFYNRINTLIPYFTRLLIRYKFQYKCTSVTAKEVYQKMQVKNLSKLDYYKSRNIPIPKQLHKLAPQPSVRSHLLQPIATMAVQIKRYIQTKQNLQIKELEHISYQKALHEFQTKIQDLTKLLSSKQDEINLMRAQKEKQQRRVIFLQKQVFDLQSQLQKLEYQYKSTIQFIKGQNLSQKLEWQERIVLAQQQQRRLRNQYECQLKTIKQSYQIKIQSLTGNKDTFKLVSEELVEGLKKDINNHINENKRLKNELILSQKQAIQKVLKYQQENFLLKQKLQNKQLQFNLWIMKNNSQQQSKLHRIQSLNEKLSQYTLNFDRQRQTHLKQRQNSQRIRIQRQQRLKQDIQDLISKNQNKEEINTRLQDKINQIQQIHINLQRKNQQLTSKLSFIQYEKHENQSRLRKAIQQLQHNYRIQTQKNTFELTKNFKQKISLLEKQLQDMRTQFYFCSQKYNKLSVQVQQKSSVLKEFRQSIRQSQQMYLQKQNQLRQLKQNYENLNKQLIKAKRQTESLKQDHQNQKVELKKLITIAKQQENNQIAAQNNTKINQLETYINSLITSHQQQINIINQDKNKCYTQIQNLTAKISELIHENQVKQNRFQALNSLIQKQKTEHKRYVDDLKRLIQDQAQALKQNTQNMEQIKNQYDNLSYQLQLKQSQIQTLKKQLKQSRINHDQLKLSSIKKCSQFEQKMSQIVINMQKQKNSLVSNLKKAQNHIINVEIRTEHLQQVVKQLQNEKQIYLSQNQRIKQVLVKKQQSTNNLLNQLNVQRKQVAQKLNQQFKQKINKLQHKNQTLIQQINDLKKVNLETQQNIHKYQIYIKEVQNKLSERQQEINYCDEKLTSDKVQMAKLQEHIHKLNTRIITIETQKKKLQAINELQSQRINKFEQNMIQMKKSNIYDTDLMQDIKSRNNKLLLINQQQRMQIQYQVNEKQKLKNILRQLQRQLQINRNQLNQKSQIYQQNKTKQEQELLENKVKQIKEEYQKKNRELFEKIVQIQQKINLKDQQLAQAKQIILERDQIQQQFLEKQTEFKKTNQQYTKFKAKTAELVSQFQRCAYVLRQKQQQLARVQKKLKQNQSKGSFHYKQLELKCVQLQTNLNIITQKYQNQSKRNNDIKQHYELNFGKMQKYKVQYQKIISQNQDLKNKIRVIELSKDQIRLDLKKQYDQILNKFRIQRQQAIDQMSEQHERIIKDLKKQIMQLNDQKIKLKNQFHGHKTKLDQQMSQYQSQILLLHQTINKLKRSNEYLYEYKKRWDKISGQVKQYQHLDSRDIIKQVDLSFNQSMKSSIIIQKPFFPKFDFKQGPFNQRKNLLQTPQTNLKQNITKKTKYRYENIDNYD